MGVLALEQGRLLEAVRAKQAALVARAAATARLALGHLLPRRNIKPRISGPLPLTFDKK